MPCPYLMMLCGVTKLFLSCDYLEFRVPYLHIITMQGCMVVVFLADIVDLKVLMPIFLLHIKIHDSFIIFYYVMH